MPSLMVASGFDGSAAFGFALTVGFEAPLALDLVGLEVALSGVGTAARRACRLVNAALCALPFMDRL